MIDPTADYENSLGMRFVPVKVGGDTVHFSIWETRYRDYRTYARAASGVDGSWETPNFQGRRVTPSDTCPVANVSWEDARRFAVWLTDKERREGRIPATARYRLPTDREWSWAVGIGELEGTGTPRDKNERIRDIYPWGGDYQLNGRAGNYLDRTARAVFPGWFSDLSATEIGEDGFATTAPVGSFSANRAGLYDLGGNVWEWCEDFYDGRSGTLVLRGGSWFNRGRDLLMSSYRGFFSGSSRDIDYGFRLVLVGLEGSGGPT